MTVKLRPCMRCRETIPLERLEILPETRLCVKCSEAVGGEFQMTAVPENLAKVNGIKKNYGGWTVRKTRRRIQLLD